jgi:hypothetical protein
LFLYERFGFAPFVPVIRVKNAPLRRCIFYYMKLRKIDLAVCIV